MEQKNIFPFAGFSKSRTINCNENGFFSEFHSDRFGFNNPDKEWEAKEIEFLIIGDSFALGNLDSMRDWGYAPDFIEAAWLMLQQDEPDDYVIATGEAKSIRDFLDAAFGCVNISGWERFVTQDPRFFRPAEVDVLCGDCSLAKEKLGWEPRTPFNDWVKSMVDNDLRLAKRELILREQPITFRDMS